MGEKIMHIAYRGAEKGRQQIALETVHSRGEEKTAEKRLQITDRKRILYQAKIH